MAGIQKLLIVVGPTSSGKSTLGVELARKFGGEIISADSRQVYKGLNIGTGKVTKREMNGIRHHLLDIASPKKIFTAADYVEKARAAYSNVLENTRIPIVVGGTGFYIDALVGRISLPDVPPDRKLRKILERKSAEQLFALLKKKDPRRATTIDRHNKRRLIRALEIAAASRQGLALPELARQGLDVLGPVDVLWVGLTVPKEELHRKIHSRLLARIRRGMIAEAKGLHAAGLSYKRMEALGLEYRALARFLQGNVSRHQMIEELDRDIRRYAKRQMTYWKRNTDIRWFNPPEKQKIYSAVRVWLNSGR